MEPLKSQVETKQICQVRKNTIELVNLTEPLDHFRLIAYQVWSSVQATIKPERGLT